MKAAVIFCTLLSLVAANVSAFSQTACEGDRIIQVTEASTCYNIEKLSGRGCSTSYVLRLHEQVDCADPYVKQYIPSKCCGLGGTKIKSFKCTRPWSRTRIGMIGMCGRGEGLLWLLLHTFIDIGTKALYRISVQWPSFAPFPPSNVMELWHSSRSLGVYVSGTSSRGI
jgi:hypothetical protein